MINTGPTQLHKSQPLDPSKAAPLDRTAALATTRSIVEHEMTPQAVIAVS